MKKTEKATVPIIPAIQILTSHITHQQKEVEFLRDMAKKIRNFLENRKDGISQRDIGGNWKRTQSSKPEAFDPQES